MDSANGEVPTKRMRLEGQENPQIPQETMLEVLLWLDRFDLDDKQITTRRLRSLVEHKQNTASESGRSAYDGDYRGLCFPADKPNTLSIRLLEGKKGGPAKVELPIETDEDAQKAASYLSSCCVREFRIEGHRDWLPHNAIVAAPALIRKLEFSFCQLDVGEPYTLSETLNGSTFEGLALIYSTLPDWLMDDKRLEALRLRGCNQLWLRDVVKCTQKLKVTGEGMLGYCFTFDDNLRAPERRFLEVTNVGHWNGVKITPAFFGKVVEASRASQLTCDVVLRLAHLRFDVRDLDVGVPPSHSEEYDPLRKERLHHVRYNIADHGNGVRLLMHFKEDGKGEWEVAICHGRKDRDEFFEPEEEEHGEE